MFEKKKEEKNLAWYENELKKKSYEVKVIRNEYENRLAEQTVPDWYKWYCSDTQIYKMLGNGWTIAVIKHIFSFIKIRN